MTSLQIPLIDLGEQYRRLRPAIDAAIQRVLDRAQYVLGPEVVALEQELAAYCGTRAAVAVASGTDALELALRACGIGPGDEVITTAFSFFATAEAIQLVGATPVFVDIDPVTYNIRPDQVAARITPRTKAMLPVHLYGQPCDMAALMRLARQHHLLVIEDCAQAIGARCQEQRVGSFGIAGCLSFYPSKNLGGYGDGGMVVTNDAQLAERIRLLRAHGSAERYQHVRVGRNSRLDELQAAILRAKLPHLDGWNAARRAHAATYQQLFEAAGLVPLADLPAAVQGVEHVYHAYVIRCRRRDRWHDGLCRRGIGVQIYYPSTLPAQPALASLGYHPGDFPEAERAAREVLSLPMYPELTPVLIEQIVNCINELN